MNKREIILKGRRKKEWRYMPWGLLPKTSNCGCACAGIAGKVFHVTAGKQSRHASRHVPDAGAVMHAGIVNSRSPLNSATGENVPGIPGACAPHNFTYLVRGPCRSETRGSEITRDKIETIKTHREWCAVLAFCFVLLWLGIGWFYPYLSGFQC